MPTMAAKTFETLPYELMHGASPRGRGKWTFAPFHLRNIPDAAVQSPEMGFTAAKEWAKRNPALSLFEVIAVLP